MGKDIISHPPGLVFKFCTLKWLKEMFVEKCDILIFDFNRKYCSGVFIYEQVEHILLACCAVFHKVRTWLVIYEANIHYLNYL